MCVIRQKQPEGLPSGCCKSVAAHGEGFAPVRTMGRMRSLLSFEDCGYHLNRMKEGYFDNPPESAYQYVLEIL